MYVLLKRELDNICQNGNGTHPPMSVLFQLYSEETSGAGRHVRTRVSVGSGRSLGYAQQATVTASWCLKNSKGPSLLLLQGRGWWTGPGLRVRSRPGPGSQRSPGRRKRQSLRDISWQLSTDAWKCQRSSPLTSDPIHPARGARR